MQEMSVFWLRAAAALYAIGLFHTIQVATRKGHSIFRTALGSFCIGVVLHLVAIVEASKAANHFPPQGFHNSVSLCAFVMAILFLFLYRKYRFESLGVLLFPLVFVMTAVASLKAPIGPWSDPETRTTLLMVHIVLVLLGYATLILTALASVLYLIQERHLKRKKPMTLLEKLPPLGTLDSIISKSMGFGFVFLTLGVVTGVSWAFIESGRPQWEDPIVTTALVTWAFCLIMVLLRISAGWRGRKAAVMAVTVVACSAATWAVHYVRR
jgi:ABC-type uncharacterized transport system permease subunit